MNELLAYGDANLDPSFDKKLCEAVADKYGADKKMSSILINRLRIEREGKDIGRSKKWNHERLHHLLMVHNIHLNQGEPRHEVLEKLADMEGIVASPTVRINNTIRLNSTLNNGHQCT